MKAKMFVETSLGVSDISFLIVSLALTVFIGLYFANKNKTFAEYARGGGDQNLWAVSASMAASYCSALTLIGNPSELYMHGSSFTLKMATAILAWPISSFVFLPIFKRLDGMSIFQYIEIRFSSRLRRFVSIVFILQMTFYSAVSLYLPSLPLFTTLGIPQLLSVGLIGVVCIVYSSFGGLRAVTWTNLYHTLLLLVTMCAIITAGTIQAGGPARLLHESLEAGRLSPGHDYFRLDLTTRHTIYNTIFGYTLIRLFLHGTSQMQVQSALSLNTARRSQLSQLLSALIYFILQMVASAIGLILFVNYKHCDPYLNGEISRQDELLMHYLHRSNLSALPLLRGMFIAAIFGSTLTIMSSYLSSASTMLTEDFVKPILELDQCSRNSKQSTTDDARTAQIGKISSVVLGLVCVLLTCCMDKIAGLQQATTTLCALVGVPILSAFLLGVTTRFVNERGMFAGMITSIAFGAYVLFCHLVDAPPLEPSLPISTSGCSSSSSSSSSNGGEGQTVGSNMFERILVSPNDESLMPLRQVVVEPLGQFRVSQMSYLWLPLCTMSISVLVASLVSLLSASLDQTINKSFSAPNLTTSHSKRQAAKTRDQLSRQLSGAIGNWLSYDSIKIKLKQQDACATTAAAFIELDAAFGSGVTAIQPQARDPRLNQLVDEKYSDS